MGYIYKHQRKVINEPMIPKSEEEKSPKEAKELKKARYTNIGLPDDMIKKIDAVIKNSNLGYKSRGEFVKEAVRNSLRELLRFKEIRQ